MALTVGIASGGQPAHESASSLRPAPTEQDTARWRDIAAALLSPSGDWFAYVVAPIPANRDGGSVEVVARSLRDDTELRYAAGHSRLGAGSLKMSHSGRWLALHVAPHDASAGEKSALSLALVDLRTRARRDFPGVRAFDFVGQERELLAIQGYPLGSAGFDLTLHDLAGSTARTLKGATGFTVSQSGQRIAWADADGLHVHDVSSGRSKLIDASRGSVYSQLTWSPSGSALAALRGATPAEYVLLALTRLDTDRPNTTIMQPNAWPSFPTGYQLAANVPAVPGYARGPTTGTVTWRDEEEGLFVAILPAPHPTTETPIVPNVAIWHWRDDYLPAQKQIRAKYVPIDWCYIDLDRKRIVRLSDDTLRDIVLQSRGRYALGYDLRAYGWNNAQLRGSSASQLRDYYLVELKTGRRTSLVRGLKVTVRAELSIAPQFSPDGSTFLYMDNNGDYVAHDVARGVHRNLTSDLPTRFYFEENDPKTGRQPRDAFGQGGARLQGWTADSAYALISDFYDVWALPLKGGQAVNLTQKGRTEDIAYRRIVLTEPVGRQLLGTKAVVDLSEPIYFAAYDLKTGNRGLVRQTPRRQSVERLHWAYADIEYYKAERADVFIYSRVAAAESKNFFRTTATWQSGQRLTDINPHEREIQPSPGRAQHLTYRNKRGKTRHAALYLPAGYVEGVRYPTLVQVYTAGFSGGVHGYRDPLNYLQRLLRRGYAVLQPDIVPRINWAGEAAVDDVNAGVDAAVATGAVDRNRLALYGDSFGAYETNFIITQSDHFKAAVAQAGMTNLLSSCGGVYGWLGPQSHICEFSQPYLGGPWWEHRDAYERNSPLHHADHIKTPLLLAHGNQDDAVEFAQSVELFNTLRRMGDKPVVLLEYEGEDHVFGRNASRDFWERVLGFLDHFLKGAPAPAWWAEGVAYYEGQAPVPTFNVSSTSSQ